MPACACTDKELLAEYEVRVKEVYQKHNPDALSEPCFEPSRPNRTAISHFTEVPTKISDGMCIPHSGCRGEGVWPNTAVLKQPGCGSQGCCFGSLKPAMARHLVKPRRIHTHSSGRTETWSAASK